MAQYTELEEGESLEITNNTNTFRYIVRVGKLYLEKESSTPDTWNIIETITGGGNGKFRIGVRSEHWVIDETLNATGFSGVENATWINIDKNKLL